VSGAPIIEVEAVTKRFPIPTVRRDTLREHALDLFRPRPVEWMRVLDAVTFRVAAGETLGIMGRNGCGKSTLLKILSGIYTADAGTVAVRAPVTAILELGVGWDPDLTAIDNVYLLGSVMGLTLREIRASLEEILAFAELERFANLELRHYSTGMAARLAYAVAFRAVRDVLLLDEIFAVGDAGFTRRCQDRYRELHAQGHTVVLVSHQPSTVAAFCDRALLLDGGHILADGTGEEVAQAYVNLLAPGGLAAAVDDVLSA
jgi:ABC-type polysaccharide/polyol phosphate transport system ATPase subunit